ncbi:MAG: helix-turn-helix transcriptional regulator [Actinomycetota bacterium]|nr:helix-turn-helix transcriptional regulator [Actinomycetota bacterium]
MRSAEVGEFLRSRRARLDPLAVGFPAGRRRAPGLRREELASLAGVTVSWLAKLEQGQAHAVSPEVLASLARALRLDDAEQGHLFALAGYRLADIPSAETDVTRALRTLVDALEPNPAYLLDRCWNIVAWNAAEARLFPKLVTFSDPPNLLELVFLDEDLGRLMADHDEELVRLVSQFNLHRTDWPDDPQIGALIDRLREESSRFTELWDAKDVSPFTTTRRLFDHPVAGRLELDHHRLAVLDQPGLQLVVYIPVGAADRARLATAGE